MTSIHSSAIFLVPEYMTEPDWIVLGAALGLHGCGSWRQGWAVWEARETFRAQKVATPAAAPLRKVSKDGMRLALTGTCCRVAAATGGIWGWQPATS